MFDVMIAPKKHGVRRVLSNNHWKICSAFIVAEWPGGVVEILSVSKLFKMAKLLWDTKWSFTCSIFWRCLSWVVVSEKSVYIFVRRQNGLVL